MGQVTITLNGRSYRLWCGEGEEPRLLQLVDHVERRLNSLLAEFGQVGDERLLVMTCVLIADELFDARAALAEARPDFRIEPVDSAMEAESTPPPRQPSVPPPLRPAQAAGAAEPADGDPIADPPLKRAMRRADGRGGLGERLANARDPSAPGRPGDRKAGGG